MSEKGIKERVINNLLLLYLINRVNKEGKIEDYLKLQKLVFLAQKKISVERKLKGFSYNFFRWIKGPFSANINVDLQLLLNSHLVTWKDGVKLTKDGGKVLHGYKEVFDNNSIFVECVDSITKKYAKVDPETLKNQVYEMVVMVPIIRKLMKIKDIPYKHLILFKTSERKARRVFEINDEQLTRLELILDVEALDFLRKAQKDAMEGKTCEIRSV